jgi:hypothetical protein
MAALSVDGNRFVISRPSAQLHGFVQSENPALPRTSRLDVPPDVGDFPCVEIHSSEALSHQIVTVLVTTRGGETESPKIAVTKAGRSWSIRTGNFNANVETTAHEPRIRIL